MRDLIFGIALMLVSGVLVAACRPRNGQTLSLVKKPLVGPALGILITASFAIGILFIAAYFTTIDEIAISGMK
jgi:hypothetical protein